MSPAILEDLFFDLVDTDEVSAAHEIEKAGARLAESTPVCVPEPDLLGFPPEEAASLDTFKSRHSVAPELFLGAYLPQRILIGYVNATLASSTSLTAESMHTHDPSGTSVCIHAVAVTEVHRRNGVSRKLLEEYILRLEDNPNVGGIRVRRILLLCHENLVSLYKSVGFTSAGNSPVVHGPQPWLEMRKDIGTPPMQEEISNAMPPDILAALGNPFRSRPSSRLLSAFASSQDLVSPSGENMFDILCPRPGCGSIILKAGVARFQTLESVELEPDSHAPPAPLERLPSPPAQVDWWLITPSSMAFENIAFSRPVPSTGALQTKLLACAECDLGPFGWSKPGDSL